MMKTTADVLLVLLLFQETLLFKKGQCLQNPQVKLPSGTVEGFYQKSVNGNDFLSFEGIPYAQPPVGNNRFKEPQPVEAWSGILKANTLYKCLQYRQFYPPGEEPIAGEEDCLYVNVYTPSLQGNFDVIVFIHGGAFMFFEPGLFGPKFLLNRNVVYVNFSYRLGPFGFLSTEDEVIPGNFGFKDQIAALKWVKENIHHFGGNSSSITLTGFSAGSASVHLHYLSPLSKNLFHRGISQSGSALNAWVLQENAREKAVRLAELLGCQSQTSIHIFNCLSQRSGRQIVNAVKEFQGFRYLPFSPFGIVIDKWSKNPVLSEHPYVLLEKGEVQDLPWIVSHVEKEGLYPVAEFLSAEGLLDTLYVNWNEILPLMLEYNYTVHPKIKNSVSQKIRKEYLQDLPLSRQNFDKLTQMATDRIFVHDMQKAVRLQASVTKSPVYYYYFTYRSAHSISELLRQSNEDLGCCHGDDTILILSGSLDTQSREKDREMSRILVDIWTSFAKDSVLTLPINEPWPEVPKDSSKPLAYVKITSPDDIEPLEEAKFGNPDFWNSLPLLENEKHFSESHTKTEL